MVVAANIVGDSAISCFRSNNVAILVIFPSLYRLCLGHCGYRLGHLTGGEIFDIHGVSFVDRRCEGSPAMPLGVAVWGIGLKSVVPPFAKLKCIQVIINPLK